LLVAWYIFWLKQTGLHDPRDAWTVLCMHILIAKCWMESFIRWYSLLMPVVRRVRKIAKSDYFVMSVRPSVRPPAWSNSTPHWMYLMKCDIWVFFWNLSRKFKFNWYLNNRYFTWRPVYIFWSYLAQSFLEWEMFQTKVVDKMKIHTLCLIFFFENRAVYEVL
jgi:hypothetical protein